MSETALNDQNFDQEVLQHQGLVLVDFYADWCGPCKMLAPILERIAKTYEGKLKICKLDVDNNPGTVDRYGVRSMPTLIFFQNGELVDTPVIGFQSEEFLKAKLDSLLA